MYILNNPSSNNIYLLFALVIAAIIIYITFIERKEDLVVNNIIEIENNYLDIKYEDLDEHLNRIVLNIELLSKSFDTKNYKTISKILNLAQTDLDLIKKTRNGIQLSDIIKLEKTRDIYSNDMDSDDKQTIDDEKFKLKISKLIDSINEIKVILKNDKLKRLKLTNVHRLLEIMNKYSKKKVHIDFDSSIKEKSISYQIIDKKYVRKSNNPNLNTKFSELSHHEGSYVEKSANDSESILYKIGFKKNNMQKNEAIISHDIENSCGNILSKKKTFDTIQYCDINKLKEEHNNMKKISTDCSFNRSLRNDYDHLDL
jgi:hypothetical protein